MPPHMFKERKEQLMTRILTLADRYPREVWLPMAKRLGRTRMGKELDILERKIVLWESK